MLRVPASTLDYWIKLGICSPMPGTSRGRRYQRYWSLRDVVIVRTVKLLREAGCSLQLLRKAQRELRDSWDTDLASAVLFWNGSDLITVDDAGNLMALVEQSGQLALQEPLRFVSVPLARWLDEVTTTSKDKQVPVDARALARGRRRNEKNKYGEAQVKRSTGDPIRRRIG